MKTCNHCGSEKLIGLRSQFVYICGDCQKYTLWPLEKNQKPIAHNICPEKLKELENA